jgi:HK97 family phage prohead protease
MNETRARRLIGTPEWRSITDFETRKAGDEFIVRGYASLYNSPYDVAGGPANGGWTETVKRGAFDVTLAAKPDVHFLINHEGVTLARTKSKTLTFPDPKDSRGLLIEARIDRRDPMGASLEVKMERGDLDEMSFAFRTVRQEWNDDYTERGLVEVNIDKGDVSVVNNGANDKTRIRITEARDALFVLASTDLIEARSLDDPLSQLMEARSHIDRLLRDLIPPAKRTMSLAEAEALLNGR